MILENNGKSYATLIKNKITENIGDQNNLNQFRMVIYIK